MKKVVYRIERKQKYNDIICNENLLSFETTSWPIYCEMDGNYFSTEDVIFKGSLEVEQEVEMFFRRAKYDTNLPFKIIIYKGKLNGDDVFIFYHNYTLNYNRMEIFEIEYESLIYDYITQIVPYTEEVYIKDINKDRVLIKPQTYGIRNENVVNYFNVER